MRATVVAPDVAEFRQAVLEQLGVGVGVVTLIGVLLVFLVAVAVVRHI